jgi:hypothetical protein
VLIKGVRDDRIFDARRFLLLYLFPATFPVNFSYELVIDRVFNYYFLSLLALSKGVGDDRIFDDRRFLLLYLFP